MENLTFAFKNDTCHVCPIYPTSAICPTCAKLSDCALTIIASIISTLLMLIFLTLYLKK